MPVQDKLLQQLSHAGPPVFQLWLDWFQSASCLPAGPLPPTRCHAWGAEVTLRADPVAMNKSKRLSSDEPVEAEPETQSEAAAAAAGSL